MSWDTQAKYLQEKGIATGVHFPRGLNQQPIFVELYCPSRIPQTEYLADHILALPVHHGVGVEEMNWIVKAVKARS